MDDYGMSIVPPVLASFMASYPLIQVQMETGLTSTMPARLDRTYGLLVIAMHPAGHGEGEFLRREQAVWAAGLHHRVEELDPLPVALYPQGCLFRKWAMEALDTARRRWRLAFVGRWPWARPRSIAAHCRTRRHRGEGRHLSTAAARAVGTRRHAATAGRHDIRLHRSARY